MLREAAAPVVNALAFGLTAFLGLSVFCHFYLEYEAVVTEFQGRAWLLRKCSEAEYYTHMDPHTDVCRRVLADHKTGALFLALSRATDAYASALDAQVVRGFEAVRALSWPFAALLGLLCVLFPTVFVGAALSLGAERHRDLPFKRV